VAPARWTTFTLVCARTTARRSGGSSMIKPTLAPPMGEPPSSVSICKCVASGISIDCMGTPLYLWLGSRSCHGSQNQHAFPCAWLLASRRRQEPRPHEIDIALIGHLSLRLNEVSACTRVSCKFGLFKIERRDGHRTRPVSKIPHPHSKACCSDNRNQLHGVAELHSLY
jgi:hypothetical protein